MKRIIGTLVVVAAFLVIVNMNPSITGAVLYGGECRAQYTDLWSCGYNDVLLREYTNKDCSSKQVVQKQCGSGEACVQVGDSASCQPNLPEPLFKEGTVPYGPHLTLKFDFFDERDGKESIAFIERDSDVTLYRRAGDAIQVKTNGEYKTKIVRKSFERVTFNDCVDLLSRNKHSYANKVLLSDESVCVPTAEGDIAIISGTWGKNVRKNTMLSWRLYSVE